MKKTVTTVCLAMLACGVTAYAKPMQSLATKMENSVNHMVTAASRMETIPAETMQTITSTAMQNYQMQGQAPTIIVQDTQNPNQSTTIKNMQNGNKNSEIIVKNQTNSPNTTQTTIYPSNTINTQRGTNYTRPQQQSSQTTTYYAQPKTNSRAGYTMRTQPSTTQTTTYTNNGVRYNTQNGMYTSNGNTYTSQNNTATQPRYATTTPSTSRYISSLQNNNMRTTESQNDMTERKGIIMIYSSKIKNGDINLTSEDKQMIREYVGIIEETTGFFKRNQGTLEKQMQNMQNTRNASLANAKLLRATQNMQNRMQNFDTGIQAMDGIIQVVENRANQTQNTQNSTVTPNTTVTMQNNTIAPNTTVVTVPYGSTTNIAQAQNATPQMEKTNPNATLVYKAPSNTNTPNMNEQVIVKNMPYRTNNHLNAVM